MNTIRLYAARLSLLTYLLIISILTMLRSDLSAHKDEISKLLIGKYSGWAILSFILLSLGSLLLAWAANSGGQRLLARLLAIYAICVLIVGLTKPTQAVHDIAALIAFITIPVATIRQPGQNKGGYYWLAAMVVSVACWPLIGFGYGERLTVYIELFWLGWLSVTFREPLAEKQ